MDTQLKKGVLEMCILFCLAKQEMYGYDLMQKMKQYFPDVSESTFYAILRRLRQEGKTESYLGEESNGPQRKYYRVTEQGRQALQENVDDWKRIAAVVTEIGI